MLLLQQLALVSALVHHSTHALPLPLHFQIEADNIIMQSTSSADTAPLQVESISINQQIPFKMDRHTFNNVALNQPWTLNLPGTIPDRKDRDIVLYSLIKCEDVVNDDEDDHRNLVRRGVFGFIAKSGMKLIKSGAKSGAFNVVSNGAAKLLGRRDVEDQRKEQQLVRRATVFSTREARVKYVDLSPRSTQDKHAQSVDKAFRRSADETDTDKGQQLMKRAPIFGFGNKKAGATATTVGAAHGTTPLKKKGGIMGKFGMFSDVAMVASVVVPMATEFGGKLFGGKKAAVAPAPIEAAPANSAAKHATPLPHGGKSVHPVKRTWEGIGKIQQAHSRDKAYLRSAEDSNMYKDSHLVKRAPIMGLSKKKKAGGAVPATGAGAVAMKKKGGAAAKLNMASNVAMLASVFMPMMSSMGGGSKAAADPVLSVPAPATPSPATKTAAHPVANPVPAPAVTKPSKRSLEENIDDQTLTRRGTVANMAGGAVTTLMLFNFGKQALGLISSHIPRITNNGVPPAVRGYSDNSQGMILYKRQPADDANQPPPSRKPGVMEGMGTVVTLGFGAQAIQENAKPMYHEITRILHKGENLAHHFLAAPAARDSLFEDEESNIVSRDLADEDEVELHARAMPAAVRRVSPQIMNAVGHIVTVSMLTSMASPFIDSAIETIKGPHHPDNNMHPMRRSLFIVDDSNSTSEALYPCSALAQTFINQRIRESRWARLNAEQERQSEDDDTFEKRANVGKIIGKVTSNKIFKQVVSMATDIL